MNASTRLRPGESWTDRMELKRAPISLNDMISPEFFDLEREAVFRRSWLYVGRVERVARPGQYFTKEIEILKTSVLVTRDKERGVRVYHNVCPHRGAKLVWDTFANREVSGHCNRFVCKFHGINYGHDGAVQKLTDPKHWLDGQGQALKLAEIPFSVWNGFIFVNLTPGGPAQSLQEFLGEPFWSQFNGFPFQEMTEHYSAVAEAQANWKTMVDGFGEVYHAGTTHQLPFPSNYFGDVDYAVDFFAKMGLHRQYITAKYPDDVHHFDYEKRTQGFGTGPRHPFSKPYMSMLPPGANPLGMDNVGTSSNMFFPNFYLQFYSPGWYVTYLMVPLAVDRMRFEIDMYMPPSRTFTELLAHKAGISMFLEAALQDFSLLECQQAGLEQRAFEHYPLTDQEVCVRAFHQQVQDTVEAYKATQKQAAR